MVLITNIVRATVAFTIAVSTASASFPLPRMHIRKDVDELLIHRHAASRTISTHCPHRLLTTPANPAVEAPAAKRSNNPNLLTPGTPVSGLVQAYAGSSSSRKRDDSLGYFSPMISALETWDGLYRRCSRADPGCVPVPFTFTVPDSADELIQIGYEGFDGLILSLVGLYIDHVSWEGSNEDGHWVDYDMSLGAGNTNYLIFADWGQNTTVGTPPTYVEGAAAGWTETSVFSIDPATGALGVHWVNPDGTYASPVFLLYSPSTNMVYVTGDVDLLGTTLGVDDLEPLTLIFSPGELASS
ncbi:hypothetical protein CALCODRAFT_506097 [Calocera cornea HHB12733]|uniref:Uncharacterized protein n=1 Tax=Calocera cornea HHB12733 TaxID=1353952 RepID=A0A165J8I5_9BASI|nr:hypothetical protein CALCODRAFT_506097 [Calocera cornea HHB12733]